MAFAYHILTYYFCMHHRSPRAKQELPAGTSKVFKRFFATKAEIRSNRIIIEKLEPFEPFRIWVKCQNILVHLLPLSILFNFLEPHQFHSTRLLLVPMSLGVLRNCCLLGFVLQVCTSQSSICFSRKEDDILPAARALAL